MAEHPTGPELLAGLTDKQREVLDLLLEHKTSKEIARQLRISPHTVDQRVQFAKDKLGAETRSEAAVAYRKLLQTYGRMTYETPGLAGFGAIADSAVKGRGSGGQPSSPKRTQSNAAGSGVVDYQVVHGLFDGRHAALIRLGAIILIAVLMVLLVLGGLAIMAHLSELLRQ